MGRKGPRVPGIWRFLSKPRASFKFPQPEVGSEWMFCRMRVAAAAAWCPLPSTPRHSISQIVRKTIRSLCSVLNRNRKPQWRREGHSDGLPFRIVVRSVSEPDRIRWMAGKVKGPGVVELSPLAVRPAKRREFLINFEVFLLFSVFQHFHFGRRIRNHMQKFSSFPFYDDLLTVN